MHVTDSKDKKSDLAEGDQLHEDAAVIIQRAWRHHSTKKVQLSSNARRKDAIVGIEKKVLSVYIYPGIISNSVNGSGTQPR